MSQRNNNQRQRRPPNSIPQGVPRDWRAFQAQLATSPVVDEDSPFLIVQRSNPSMPTEGEARFIANLNNARDLRLGALNNNASSDPLPTYPPLQPLSQIRDSAMHPRRQSSLQSMVSPRTAASPSSRNISAPTPRVPSDRNLIRPLSITSQYSPYRLDAAEEDLQRRVSAHSPHVQPPHVHSSRVHSPHIRDRTSGGSPSTDGSVQHAGTNTRGSPGLAELRQGIVDRENALSWLQRRRQAMPMPMPRARIEHFKSLPTAKEDPECPICMEDYDGGEHCAIQLQRVSCGHIFGRKCIQEWVNSEMPNAHRCPSCRRSIGGSLVDAETGTSVALQQELAYAAAIRHRMEQIQATLARHTSGNIRGPLETARVISRRREARDNMAPGQHQGQPFSHSGPSSPPPAPIQYRTSGRPPQQPRPSALSTQERFARIQRNIAALTSERGLRTGANVAALAMSDPARLISQDIQAMIERREEELRELGRQIEAAHVTRDVLVRHAREVDMEEERASFRRRLHPPR